MLFPSKKGCFRCLANKKSANGSSPPMAGKFSACAFNNEFGLDLVVNLGFNKISHGSTPYGGWKAGDWCPSKLNRQPFVFMPYFDLAGCPIVQPDLIN
jgi:hypothetical protein